jgi:hypothetical protein
MGIIFFALGEPERGTVFHAKRVEFVDFEVFGS